MKEDQLKRFHELHNKARADRPPGAVEVQNGARKEKARTYGLNKAEMAEYKALKKLYYAEKGSEGKSDVEITL